MRTHLDRRQFLLRTSAAACAACLPPGTLWSPDDHFADLAARIPQWMKEAHLPGASVAIAREGQPVWKRGFGMRNVALRAPVNDSTVFEAASLSKPVFAYAVLTLIAEGKLDLDRPLTDTMPQPFRPRVARVMASEIPNDPRLKRITPRMVLCHTTGFPNWGRRKPLTFLANPGEKFGYSGEGYVYLQNVVEHVSGVTLEVFARKRVFEPLGMASTSFIWRFDFEDRVALGYNREGVQEKRKDAEAVSAASLHTTAEDFAKFMAEILRPGGKGLRKEWVARMLNAAVKIDDSLSWGLGWGLEVRPKGHAFWQWGDNGEFKAFAIGSREEQTAVVVLTNNGLGMRVCRKIIEHVLPGPHPALDFGMVNYS